MGAMRPIRTDCCTTSLSELSVRGRFWQEGGRLGALGSRVVVGDRRPPAGQSDKRGGRGLCTTPESSRLDGPRQGPDGFHVDP